MIFFLPDRLADCCDSGSGQREVTGIEGKIFVLAFFGVELGQGDFLSLLECLFLASLMGTINEIYFNMTLHSRDCNKNVG